jgi:hypothetical protein
MQGDIFVGCTFIGYMPFYVRNYRFWYLCKVLEPVPHRYQGMTVPEIKETTTFESIRE